MNGIFMKQHGLLLALTCTHQYQTQPGGQS